MNKRPLIITLILVLLTIFGIGMFQLIQTMPTVLEGARPKNVEFTNITENSFSIVWQTKSPALGSVRVTTPQGDTKTVFDERDTAGVSVPRSSHSVSVQNLDPDTSYSMFILSNGKPFGQNTSPLTITTAPLLKNSTEALKPIYGTLFTDANLPAEDALVFATIDGSQTLSAVVSTSGTYMIPLTSVRSPDLLKYLTISNGTPISIIAYGNDKTSNAETFFESAAPVPLMTLGQTYDFRKKIATQNTPSTKTVSQTTNASEADIVFPPKNGAISTRRPLIRGVSLPNASITLTLGITKPVSVVIRADSQGKWSYTPEIPLTPGRQSVTITTKNKKNAPYALTHVFEVLKSGTQVLGDATPSGITPSPTETPEATPSPTITSLFPTPTVESTPSAIVSITPTMEPSPTAIPIPTQILVVGNPPPVSGTPLPLMMTLLAGAVCIVLGISIFPKRQ